MIHTSYCFTLCEGDRGSRVTLVGLGANVLLTSAKGAAGWYMNSAALLADAGHSLSGEHALTTSCPPFSSKRYCAIVCVPGGGGLCHALACAPGAKAIITTDVSIPLAFDT